MICNYTLKEEGGAWALKDQEGGITATFKTKLESDFRWRAGVVLGAASVKPSWLRGCNVDCGGQFGPAAGM